MRVTSIKEKGKKKRGNFGIYGRNHDNAAVSKIWSVTVYGPAHGFKLLLKIKEKKKVWELGQTDLTELMLFLYTHIQYYRYTYIYWLPLKKARA